MKMLPTSPHEFEVMLRREYERGVEDSAVIAQSAIDGMAPSHRLNLPVNVFHLGLRLPRELLGRATQTQRTFDILKSIAACLEDGLSVIIEPPAKTDNLSIVVMRDEGKDTKSKNVVASSVDSIFKMQDILNYSRLRIKGENREDQRAKRNAPLDNAKRASEATNPLPKSGDDVTNH